MRYCVVNLGCKVNRVESDGFERLLVGQGLVPAEPADADVLVVNTCTVTAEAEKKARKAVRQALRANDHAPVLVTGCATTIAPGEFQSLGERVRVVPKDAMGEALVELAADAHGSEAGRSSAQQLAAPGARARVGVKVQDGCDHACTYCIVHVARGPARSRPAAEAVAEARALASAGVRELVLTGINLGSYQDGDIGLASLLEQLLEATGAQGPEGELPTRLRLSSIEPCDVDDALVDLLAAADGRICRHLHLPLQSGSDRVLAEMGRPYDAEAYLGLVERLRARVPGISLSTDIIVGFPGETEADFQATCDLARACGFSRIHVFPYSRRQGTPAAVRADQVPPEQVQRRAAQLRGLAAELRSADRARRSGTWELCLVEAPGRAMAESYHEVTVDERAEAGKLVSVRLG